MVTNITGFQQARRRAAERAARDAIKDMLKDAKVEAKGPIGEAIVTIKLSDDEAEDMVAEVMTEEEVKAKLIELGVPFHPNAKLKTLQEKLKAAEANG